MEAQRRWSPDGQASAQSKWNVQQSPFFFQIKVEGRKGNYVVLNDVLGSVVVKYAATVRKKVLKETSKSHLFLVTSSK